MTVGQNRTVAAKRVSVLQACVARLGAHRGARAAANVAQYAITTRELGHVPTTVEYADYWALSERSGWDHRARVKSVFGDDWREVVETVAAEIERRSTREVMGLPIPARLAAA